MIRRCLRALVSDLLDSLFTADKRLWPTACTPAPSELTSIVAVLAWSLSSPLAHVNRLKATF